MKGSSSGAVGEEDVPGVPDDPEVEDEDELDDGAKGEDGAGGGSDAGCREPMDSMSSGIDGKGDLGVDAAGW